MSSRRRYYAAILALLVLPGLVAGPAFASCSHEDPAPHPCCAAESPSPAGGHGCCDGESAGFRTASAADDCSCSHAPELPANPTVSPSPAAQKDAADQGRLSQASIPESSERGWSLSRNASKGPPPGHAPLFLLDCSFLI